MKERRKTRGEWLIEAHTQNIGTLPFNCNNTKQDKGVVKDEGKGAMCVSRVLMMSKARISDG